MRPPLSPRSRQHTDAPRRLPNQVPQHRPVPPSAAVALAAALVSVRRAPATEDLTQEVQPRTGAGDALSAERDRAWSRAHQARALMVKEYLDQRATPVGHPAAEKERHERN